MPWGSFFRPRDSKGRESRTLTFVSIAFFLLSIRFFFSGMQLDFGWWHWEFSTAGLVDYGAAIAAVLSIWLGREWIQERASRKEKYDV